MSSLIAIQEKIAELQAQEAEIKAREFNEKVVMIKETMASYGITVDDLQGKPAKATKVTGTKSAKPAPAKYQGPNGESWSGRGLAPKWLAALIADGRSKEEFLINK
jgi:DNA-binding protein H-NS